MDYSDIDKILKDAEESIDEILKPFTEELDELLKIDYDDIEI